MIFLKSLHRKNSVKSPKTALVNVFFCLVIFTFGAIVVQAGTVNKQIGGTITKYVNGQPIPLAGATVILRLETADTTTNPQGSDRSVEYRTFVSDANGYYGPTGKTFYCSSGYFGVSASIVLDDGTIQQGNSGGGGWSCDNAEQRDMTNQFHVATLYSAQNNPQNAGENCPLQNVGEPVNVSNGNMWFKQTDYILPGIGKQINVTRTYNVMVQRSGLFGVGWTSEYDEFIPGLGAFYKSNGQIVIFNYLENNMYESITKDFYGQIVKNSDNTYTLTYKDGSIQKFNSNGKLAWKKDRNGNQTTLSYNSYNQLIGVTDASNRTLTFTPNANGMVSQISDSTGTIATYEYNNPNATLKTVTYADGSKYKFEYDTTTAPGKILLKTVKDALDNILETHEYDSSGRATTSEKHGGVEKYTLDYAHILDNAPYTTVTDALGRVTKYYFDKSKGRNVVTKTEGNCNCGGGSEVTTYEYDDKLNLKKKVDALNRQTTYTYNATGDPLTMTDVWGTSVFTYNSFGQILTYKDRMNGVWTNTYDANGNLKTTKDALDNVTTVEYPLTNNKGLPDSIKDARNKITKFKWFAGSGLLEETEDANGKKTNFTYDARARTKTVTNALNHTTTYNYFDDSQRKVEMIYPNADKITYKYNIRRLLESVTDERGKITTYEFDAARRLKKITDPLNHFKELDYDLMSNLNRQKDALGNQTDYLYDNFNRLKEVQYPIPETGAARLIEKYEYDALGRIKKFYDSANRLTEYGYDDLNRTNTVTNAELEITTTKYNQRFQTIEVKDALNQIYNFSYDALGRQLSQTRAGAVMSYEYDPVGNRTKRTDYIGRVTNYEYDDLNRLKKILYGGQAAANNPPNEQSIYNYDDISRLTSAVNEAGTVSFGYDNRNRLTSATDVFGHLIEYGYDAASNRTQLKLNSNMHTNYIYDDADRLTTLTDEANQNFTFGYDIADKLISKTLPNGVNTTYEYDGMSRLKRLKDVSSTATLFDRQYTYNSASQISQIIEPTQTRNFGYDNVNRLISMNNGTANESYAFDDVGNRTSSHRSASYGYQPFNKITSTANSTINYDANGNMVTKLEGSNFWRYVWDYENRMTSASTRKETVRYRYDALGRRVQRYFKGGKENTKFIYDGQDVLVDDNAGVLTKYQNGLGIDDKLKVSLNGTAKYFLTDHLGSTNALTNSSGAITESASYDSFGNATNNLSTRYQFTGREFDNFTGLHFYRARWYDSNLGRFISEDPIGFAGGDVNLFGYVKNNSANLIDPNGLDGCKRLPNGKCEPPPQIPTGGEPSRPNPWIDPPRPSPTPSVSPMPTVAPPSAPPTSPSEPNSPCDCETAIPRFPDFYTLNVSMSATPLSPVLGGGFSVTLDRYGQVYGQLHGGIGFPSYGGINGGPGWMLERCKPKADKLENFHTGWGTAYGGFAPIPYSPLPLGGYWSGSYSSNDKALTFGAANNPSGFGSWGYGWRLY